MKFVQNIKLMGIDHVATASKIKELIRSRGLNQKQIGELLNLRSQSVDKWCSFKNLPSLDNLYDLSIILDCPVDSLLVGNSTITPVKRCDRNSLDNEIILVRNISR